MEVLVLVLILGVAIGGVLLHFHLKQRRREELHRLALEGGMSFTAADTFGLVGLPFRLFRKGDGRGVENVLWGEWQGQALKAFDYWYYEESSSSEGRRSRTYHRFSCVVLHLPAVLPDLEVIREGVLSRLADHVGFPDIDFESEEFNRRFQVRSSVRRFAFELVDARMIRWLLSLRRNECFEVSGPNALFYCRRLRPVQVSALLGAATAFRKRIPKVVWGLYGSAGSPAVPPPST